jgi:hypothetical protein
LHSTEVDGALVEYYLVDRFVPNPALGDQDFDPDALWPSKRAAAPRPEETTDRSARRLPPIAN